MGGLHPVVAVYSTFLNRAFDQLLMDVALHGQPVTVGFAIVREFLVRGLLIGLVGGFFLGLPFLLDLLWPLWDERNQTLHDKIVSSYVIKADTPPMAAPA